MNRLYIISDSELHGAALANMNLGLSSGQFKVITNHLDLDLVPDRVIYLHDKDHYSIEGVTIDTELRNKGCLSLKDIDLAKINIVKLLDLFKYYTDRYLGSSDEAISKAMIKLNSILKEYGYTSDNYFEFDIIYDGGVFGFVPKSPRMECILNLFRGLVNNLSLNKFEGIKINDPHGYFNNRSIDVRYHEKRSY